MAVRRFRITHIINKVDKRLDVMRLRLYEKLRIPPNPLLILPYNGFGTREKVYLKGRVLEDKGILPAGENDAALRNFRNMFHRFNSREVPGAVVEAQFYGTSALATADEEGFFELVMPAKDALPQDRLWHEIRLALTSPDGHPDSRASGSILVPPPAARFGVISDLDDTVVQTGASSLLRMVRNFLFSNARTRLPFKGVAAFYQALHQGTAGNECNPLFYVSSSPWNLYDMLCEFFRVQGIPAGPLLLRDWGISEDEILPLDHRRHKLRTIRHILDFIPALPFILIGDSGQTDPEIYHEVSQLYPGRIRAVYIRNVSQSPRRQAAVRAIAETVHAAGSVMIVADDTVAAARHAIEQGWIGADSIPDIEADKRQDQTLLERALNTQSSA